MQAKPQSTPSHSEKSHPPDLSITRMARALGVTREDLSRLVNGKIGISPVMAIRLSKAFNTTPELWLGMQQQYVLRHVRQNADQIKVQVLTEEPAAV